MTEVRLSRAGASRLAVGVMAISVVWDDEGSVSANVACSAE
jgi:hypothetical protein